MEFSLLIHGVEDTDEDGYALFKRDIEVTEGWAAIAKRGYVDVEIPVLEAEGKERALYSKVSALGHPVGTYDLEPKLTGRALSGEVVLSTSSHKIVLQGTSGPWAGDVYKDWAKTVKATHTNKINDQQLWNSLVKAYKSTYPDNELVRLTISDESWENNNTTRHLFLMIASKDSDGVCRFGRVNAIQNISGSSRSISDIRPQYQASIPCNELEKARNVN